MKKIYLLSLLCVPTLAYAHFSISEGACLGFFLGILLGIIITMKIKANKVIKTLIFFPITFIAMFICTYIGDGISDNLAEKKYQAQKQLFYSNPLRNAICNSDVKDVKNILSNPLDDFTKKNVGNFLMDCSRDEINNKTFVMIMNYLSLQGHNPNVIGYCNVLQDIHSNYKVSLLKSLLDSKLSIICNDKIGTVTLNGYLNSYLSPEEEEKIYDWLKFLVESKFFENNKNLNINEFVDKGSARVILLSLELGDFNKKIIGYPNAPIDIWTKRIVQYCDECSTNTSNWKLSKEEIEIINNKIQ